MAYNNETKYIYLDSAASASDSRFHVVDDFANPNSIHDAGRYAFSILEGSREKLTNLIGAKRPSEIIFTSGATEGNNMAILGIARANKARKSSNKPKILISQIEHESILEPAHQLEKEGFVVNKIPVDKNGMLDFEEYSSMIDEDTVLVSIQIANTEIGLVNNLGPFVQLAHENGAVFHSDCVGGFCRIPIDVNKLQIDCATFSGHKIGASKGIGFLYLKSDVDMEPLIYGSGQESGIRGGTQNVAMAKSLAMAADYNMANMKKINEHFYNLKNFMYNELSTIDGVDFTIQPNHDNQLSNIVHLSFNNKNSEDIILYLGKKNIIVAGGPACNSDNDKPSYVLEAIGVSLDKINGSIRLSFMESTSQEDVKIFIDEIKNFMRK